VGRGRNRALLNDFGKIFIKFGEILDGLEQSHISGTNMGKGANILPYTKKSFLLCGFEPDPKKLPSFFNSGVS